MPSPCPPSPPQQLPQLAKCRLARVSNSPQRLAVLAQVAITSHPSNAEAWTHLAEALHVLHRPQNALQAIKIALTLSPSHPRLTLFDSVSLQIRLHDQSPSPTSRLQAGWYKAHLQNLIHADKLFAYPSVSQRRNDPTLANLHLSDCSIVTRPSGNYDQSWDMYTNRDGGTRDEFLPPSLLSGFPLDQTTGGYLFLKKRVVSFGCCCYDESCAPCRSCLDPEVDLPTPVYRFPKLNLALPKDTEILGGPLLGVHVVNGLVARHIHNTLASELHRLGVLRPDSPVPKYHNVIDPNIGAVNGLWMPTEFDVKQVPSSQVLRVVESAMHIYTSCTSVPRDILNRIHELCGGGPSYGTCVIRSKIPDLDPYKYSALYLAIEEVFNAALPLLANLQLPALLLPGPLQVVVKVQRIVLNENDSYEGIWHDDGFREHVVAIVLYYYGLSPCLQGGGMEIASKRRQAMWVGDAEEYEFDVDGVRKAIGDMYRCVVPISEGTMLVFNNYAAVHRVLPMLAKGGSGSRDFIAFFVIDQRHPLPMPERVGPRKERILRRADMLREQLEVRGFFGMDGSEVVSCGNGTVSDLAWIASGDIFPIAADTLWEQDDMETSLAIVSRLNMTPPVIGRGSSFLTHMDLPDVQFNPASSWMLHVIKVEPRVQAFVDTEEMVYSSLVPEEQGIRAVKVYDNAEQWLELGFKTDDDELHQRIAAEVG